MRPSKVKCYQFVSLLATFVYVRALDTCSSIQEQYASCSQPPDCWEGDVTLAMMTNLHVSSMNSHLYCDQLNDRELQHVIAVKWIITKLNDINYIPGVKWGMSFALSAYKYTIKQSYKYNIIMVI